MTDGTKPAPWAERLREEGRSMSWLSSRVGVSRQYLSAVAGGTRSASPALLRAIDRELGTHPPTARLDAAGDYAVRRGTFLGIRDRVAGMLADVPELADVPHARVEELADDVCRVVLASVSTALQEVAEA